VYDSFAITDSIRLNEPPIKVIVGAKAVFGDEESDFETINKEPDKEIFYLDSGVLKQGGTFFATALKKEWLEGQQGIIYLPEEQPRIFRPYAQWLYTGKIFYETGQRSDDLDTLSKLYTLGERLMDRGFQDSVLDICRKTTNA